MDQRIKAVAGEYAAACSEEALDLLRTLGKIPAPTRHEDLRAVFCRDWLLTQGAVDVTIDKAKNVICKIGCEDHEDIVAFAAHTDIVFPDMEDLPMREEDGKLYAPGIGDDTSNLVNLLMGAKYLLKNQVKLKCGVLIVCNACEEGLGNLDGAKELFASYGPRIKAFYSFDGYTPQCCSTAVGSYRYKISCKTVGGHSYINFGEPNAIEILCRLVEELYKIQAPSEVKTTYNVGHIEGGTTVNSIPQACSMLYEFRSDSREGLSYMERQFDSIIDAKKGQGMDIQVEIVGLRPCEGDVDLGVRERMLRLASDTIQEYTGREPGQCPGSTDCNIPLSLGIPSLCMGTYEGSGAHTREEYVVMDSLMPGYKVGFQMVLSYI